MRKTPLRPGSPPARKTGLRAKPFNPADPFGLRRREEITIITREDAARILRKATRKAEAKAASRAKRTRREQIQRMERFGTYAWLIRVLPCAGCYPTMYKGSIALEKTVAAFAEFTGKRHMAQSEAAHLKSVGAGGLADGNLLPLCAKCHRLAPNAIHNVPASEFANRIGLPLASTAKAIAATPQGKALLSIDKRAVKALRDLTVHAIAPNAWRVTGGETPGGHVVTGNGSNPPSCTCQFARSHPAQVCKHRIAVRLYEGARLDTVLREVVAA